MIDAGAGVSGWLIALVAAVMGFFAVAGVTAGSLVTGAAEDWTGEVTASATIRVTAPADEQAAVADAALAIARSTPGVSAARLISEDEAAALLAPWLGQEADITGLPVPLLIDVTLSGDGPDIPSVRKRLAAGAPGAEWDDHADWKAPFSAAARTMRLVAGGAVILPVIVLAAMIATATLASFWSRMDVVRTLRLIGADDGYILRMFERPFAIRAGLGAAAGSGAAVLLAIYLAPEGALSPEIQAALPVAAALTSALTALLATRIAARIALRKE